MEWKKITSIEFEDIRRKSGVCIVPLGCLERHSDFLPLGTDSLLAYKLACLAAEKEPALVFPAQHYMMVASAAAQPGAVVINAKLSIEIIETVFDEISRNGFKKIILYNFHGGNRNIVPLFLQNHLARQPKDYILYMPKFDWDIEDVYTKYCQSDFGGHADEWETSLMLYLFPELVKKELIPNESVGLPLKQLQHLHDKQIKTSVDFYSDFPTHYAGNAQCADSEKGKRAVDAIVQRLAEVIKTVKEDKKTENILKKFSNNMFKT